VPVVSPLAAGQALSQPVLFGFVETKSIAPTLAACDGFVTVSAALAEPVDEGDVVVFRTEQVGDRGLTTHRVVDDPDQRYVTRGDANSFTDQANGEPPVKELETVAVVWAPGETVFVITELWTAVLGL
jgi:signal peptidase